MKLLGDWRAAKRGSSLLRLAANSGVLRYGTQLIVYNTSQLVPSYRLCSTNIHAINKVALFRRI
jgi:hypothetical protein